MDTLERHFNTPPQRIVRVPGRVNLLGEWVDFNGGLVLPMSLPLLVQLAVSENGSGEDVIVSAEFDGEARFGIDAGAQSHWADYVRGSLQAARKAGWMKTGANVALASNIPHGSGLSSSAAVTVATLLATQPATRSPDLVEIAKMARQVENDFLGVPCGIMDQMAVALAPPGKVLALDTSDLSFELIDLPGTWQIAVVHSGVSRKLADGRYAERRAECLAAADALGVEELCRAELAALASLPEPLWARARHVVNEDVRTRAARDALIAGDAARFGALMNDGHASIRDDFCITTPEVDALVADAVRLGALGARQTGGGFGGCIVALLEQSDIDAWWIELNALHPAATRVV